MKIKHSIFVFIPCVLAMLVLKLGGLFFADSDGYFLSMNGMNVANTVIGITIGLFAVCVVMNVIDRKTAPVYAVKRNPFAGVLSIMLGVAVAASSFMGVVSNRSESEYYAMTLATALISIPAAIALIIMCKVHFSGETTVSNLSLLYVFPAVWGCAELVKEFLGATKISVSSTDMTALFCYIFITLYFFYHAMIVSRVKGKNPVKSCFCYGLPACAVSLTFGIYQIFYTARAVENLGISELFSGICLLLTGLYSLSVLIEMSTNTLSKDEVEIIGNIPEDGSDEEEKYAGALDYDDLVLSRTAPAQKVKDNGIGDYMTHTEELDDFIMGYDTDAEDDEPVPYFTKEERRKSIEEADMFVTESRNGMDYAEEVPKRRFSKIHGEGRKSDSTSVESAPAPEETADASAQDFVLAEDEPEPTAAVPAAEPAPEAELDFEPVIPDTSRRAPVQPPKPAEPKKPENPEAGKSKSSDIDELLRQLDSMS